jgi:hypothetical protein
MIDPAKSVEPRIDNERSAKCEPLAVGKSIFVRVILGVDELDGLITWPLSKNGTCAEKTN